MSENARFYQQKMAQLRNNRSHGGPLRQQLSDIFSAVAECEARWALEDRIERQTRRD